MLAKTQDNKQIIERVAALDIGKAELMCCVRVPDEDRPGRRLQEDLLTELLDVAAAQGPTRLRG